MRRKLVAEALGTALLLYVVVGSGIVAQQLVGDPGVGLLAHALAVGLGLGVLVAMLQAVSGAHFNPSVTLAFWRLRAIGRSQAAGFAAAQVAGGIVGVALANWSFGEAPIALSSSERDGAGLLVAEAIATFVLVLVIVALVRTGRSQSVPAAVGAWVAAAIFATSSTGFANPAVTLARAFTDTFTGIAPGSVPAFIAAQLLAGLLAALAALAIYPNRAAEPATV
ncbi:MAG TPA: aquaporin [Acidimicrobiia bacterium]